MIQKHQPVHPHKTLGNRYLRYSLDFDGSQAGEISDPPVWWNNNSNDHCIAMNVSHKEGECHQTDWSEDQLVDNLVACMICRVVDETLGFSEADEQALELQQESLSPPRQSVSQVL